MTTSHNLDSLQVFLVFAGRRVEGRKGLKNLSDFSDFSPLMIEQFIQILI